MPVRLASLPRPCAAPKTKGMSVSREELYELVWAEPMTKVALRYRVSSNFLARVCDRLRVPKPGRGYWARLAAGEAVEKPPLPEVRPGDFIEWSRGGAWTQVSRAQVATTDRKRPRRRRGERPAMHELLVGARGHFESGRVDEDRSIFRRGAHYLVPSKRLLADIFVSRGALDGALELANELFLVLEDLGHEVTIPPHGDRYRRPDVDERADTKTVTYPGRAWRPVRPTVVLVNGVAMGITIFELSHEVEGRYVGNKWTPLANIPAPRGRKPLVNHGWTSTRELPSGRLCLRLSSSHAMVDWEKQWREKEPGELRATVARIAKEIIGAAPPLLKLIQAAEEQAAIEHAKWLERQREWERAEKERRRVQNIEDARKDLLRIIDDWRVKTGIEAFFQQVEMRANELGDAGDESIRERLRKARALIGPVDALTDLRRWRAPDER